MAKATLGFVTEVVTEFDFVLLLELATTSRAGSASGTYVLDDGDNEGLVPSEDVTVTGFGDILTLRYNGYVVDANSDGILYPIYVDTATNKQYIFSYVSLADGADIFLGTPAIDDSPPLCLTSGALICVVEGEIPVECLSIGDLVATPDGLRRVRFISETRKPPIELRRQGRLPIRIEAGALGELGPQVPLHCTPSHAFLIKGCLVEARALINGTTIRQLESWDEETVTYYSIELEEHALVWANGLLSETYFASVRGKHFSRTSWSNYADYQALYGEGELMQELPHPRIPFARQLPQEIRQIAGVPDQSRLELCLR